MFGSMRITLNELTVPLQHLDGERLVDDWRWLIGTSKQPILLSAIGDAFVQDQEDGAVYLLDTAAGSCTLVADDEQHLRELLNDPDWVTNHLAVHVVADFLRNGLRLEPGQVYSWKQPPALGGEYELANAEVSDIGVHFSVTGQIHRQIQNLPPGIPLDQIRMRPRSE